MCLISFWSFWYGRQPVTQLKTLKWQSILFLKNKAFNELSNNWKTGVSCEIQFGVYVKHHLTLWNFLRSVTAGQIIKKKTKWLAVHFLKKKIKLLQIKVKIYYSISLKNCLQVTMPAIWFFWVVWPADCDLRRK